MDRLLSRHTKKHKTAAKICKMTTERHKSTTKKHKMTRERPKPTIETQNDQKMTTKDVTVSLSIWISCSFVWARVSFTRLCP